MKKQLLATGLSLFSLSFSLMGNPKEVELYHELLKDTKDSYLLEVLSEGAKRALPLPKDLSSLWKVNSCRKILLQSMTISDCQKLKIFSPKVFLEMSRDEQAAIWLRGNREKEWWEEKDVLKLGQSVYASSPEWAKKLILSIHEKTESDMLLDQGDVTHKLRLNSNVKPNELHYKEGDSTMLIKHKLKVVAKLPKEKQGAIVATYKNVNERLKPQVIPFYSEKELLALLKNSKHEPSRAVAIRTLLSLKWVEWQVERVMKGKSWAEAQEVYNYFVAHPERITEKAFDKYWKLSSDVGRTLLSAFLWKHPKDEVSKTLRDYVDKSNDRGIALKALFALPPHNQSEWLKGHLKAKKWEADLHGLAMDILWEWKEVPEDRFYLDIFLNQGYKAGGAGMESLLKLLGLSKHKQASKVISSFFKEVEEPVVEVDVAIEASGWHGVKDYLRSLNKFVRDGNTDPVLKWAVERCEGKTPPLPIEENVTRAMNPYFFHSLDADY